MEKQTTEKATRQKKGTPIYAKLAKVLDEIHRVPKNGRNDFHKYDYVMESDLTDHIRPLLAKHGLALMFGSEEIMDMGNGLLAVKCNITLGDSDGNEIHETIWGMGQDKGDKAVYKAMTGAMKYWLYKTFLVSTGDDPEQTNGHRPEATKSASQSTGSSKMTEAHVDTLSGIYDDREHLKATTLDWVKKLLNDWDNQQAATATAADKIIGAAFAEIEIAGREASCAIDAPMLEPIPPDITGNDIPF